MEQVSAVLAGFQESLLPEVERFWIENPRFAPERDRAVTDRAVADRAVVQPTHTPEPPNRKRYQVGWIEQRWGNKSREKQSLSLYYCYYASEWELHGEGSKTSRKKQRLYLQAHQCQEISAMVRQQRPYPETLAAIGRTKRHSSKPHHMTAPKI